MHHPAFALASVGNWSSLGASPDMRPKLLFDLAEVLTTGLLGVEQVIARAEGMPVQRVAEIVAGPCLWTLFRGEITEAEFLSRIQAEGGWQMSLPELSLTMRGFLRGRVPGMPEFVELLARDCDLYLLSDHAREWIPSVEECHPFLGLFRKRYYSFALGCVKRDGRPFRMVLDDLGIGPSELFFVDDSPGNVATAREIGIEAVVFQGREHLEPVVDTWIQRRRMATVFLS